MIENKTLEMAYNIKQISLGTPQWEPKLPLQSTSLKKSNFNNVQQCYNYAFWNTSHICHL